MKSLSLWLSLALSFAVAATVQAQANPQTFQAGVDYRVLSHPVPTSNPGKIEVVEFFSYHSPASNTLQPTVNILVQGLAEDVAFRKVPVQWTETMATHAQLFYTTQALNVRGADQTVFQAIHQGRKRLETTNEMAALLAPHGVRQDNFVRAYNSFGVRGSMNQARSLAQSAGVRGVPAFMVNGRYVVDQLSGQSHGDILQVVDFLISRERQAIRP